LAVMEISVRHITGSSAAGRLDLQVLGPQSYAALEAAARFSSPTEAVDRIDDLTMVVYPAWRSSPTSRRLASLTSSVNAG
jgi:hypothetical protein